MDAEQVVPLSETPRQVPSSLTVVEQVYYRARDENPTHIETRYSRVLSTDEQIYVRRLNVGEEWYDIGTGWIERCAMIVIQNEEGKGLQQIPTVEQQKEIDSRVVELGYGEIALFKILPKESFRGTPSLDFKKLMVMCINGTARIRIHLIPE